MFLPRRHCHAFSPLKKPKIESLFLLRMQSHDCLNMHADSLLMTGNKSCVNTSVVTVLPNSKRLSLVAVNLQAIKRAHYHVSAPVLTLTLSEFFIFLLQLFTCFSLKPCECLVMLTIST